MLRHVRLTTLVALFVVIPAVAVAAAPFAYVSNSGSSSILVIDTGSTAVTSFTLPLGKIPWGVAVLSDGSRVYVTNFASARGGGSLLAIETRSGGVIREVPLGNFPYGVAVHPTNGTVYVSMAGNGNVFAIDPVTFTNLTAPPVMSSIPVGSPRGVALDPAGRRLFVTSNFTATLSAFDETSTPPHALLGSIAVGVSPMGVVVSPDGSRVYVANEDSNTVSVINAAGDTFALIAHVPVGNGPVGVTVTPDGSRVYVTNSLSGTVSALDADGNRIRDDVFVGSNPFGIGTNGSSVYVAVQQSNKVVELSLNLAILREIPANVPIAFGQFVLPQLKVATTMALTLSSEATILGSTAPMIATATLVRRDSSAPVAGASVAFTLDGTTTGSALTGADGAAQWSFTASTLTVGTHTVQASFAETRIGGLTYEASGASGQFGIQYQFTWLSSGGTATAGSTIPVRWSLTDASGNAIANAAFSVTSAPCPTTAVAGPGGVKAKANFAGNSELRYDASTNQYLFNWKSDKAWAGTCRQLFVEPKDGTSHSLTFQFR